MDGTANYGNIEREEEYKTNKKCILAGHEAAKIVSYCARSTLIASCIQHEHVAAIWGYLDLVNATDTKSLALVRNMRAMVMQVQVHAFMYNTFCVPVEHSIF